MLKYSIVAILYIQRCPLVAEKATVLELDGSNCVRSSFLTCALKSPKRIVHAICLTLRSVSLISSTNCRYNALALGPYATIKHREQSNFDMHKPAPDLDSGGLSPGVVGDPM